MNCLANHLNLHLVVYSCMSQVVENPYTKTNFVTQFDPRFLIFNFLLRKANLLNYIYGGDFLHPKLWLK